MEYLIVALAFLGGVLFGGMMAAVISAINAVGVLRIDSSDPDSPYLFLELHQPESVERLRREQFVTLRVNPDNYISHE